MLITGLVFALPGESFYSRLRRVYESNLSQKRFGTGFIINSFNWINPETGLIKTMGSSEKIHKLMYESEKLRFKKGDLENQNFKVFKHSSTFIKKYKPLKHCKECAKEGFHSILFDHDWINICPIHDVKLLGKCPECERIWPTISQLKKRKCEICGLTPGRTQLNKKYTSGLQAYKPFLRLEYFINQLIPRKFPNVEIYLFNFDLFRLQERPNSYYPLLFSSLVYENIKAKETLTLMKLFGIKLLDVTKKSFNLNKYDFRVRNNADLDYKNQEAAQIRGFSNQLLSQIHPHDHELFSCVNSNGACVDCSKHIVWNVVSEDTKELFKHEEYENLKEVVSWMKRRVFMKRRKPKHVELIFKESNPSKERQFYISDDFRHLLFSLDCRVILDNLQRENFFSSSQVTWHVMRKQSENLLRFLLRSVQYLVIKKDRNKLHVFFECF